MNCGKILLERYGQSNGPLIYHIERELSKVSQGNLTVAAYFTKIKKFWDELYTLNGIPTCSCGRMRECTCGITEKFLEIEGRSKLMQFLMRLNDDYEAVRSQILSMDPLPNVNRAYYIVQQVEKQKQVTNNVGDPTTFFANLNPSRSNYGARRYVRQLRHNDNRNDSRNDVRNENRNEKKTCTYCHHEGHNYDQCFERLGYPGIRARKRRKGLRLLHMSM